MNGRTALVTGAASGIGKATANRLSSDGLSVVVADVDENGCAAVAADIAAAGGVATSCVLDVRDRSACERAVEQAGAIDVLVANAGIQTGGSLVETSDETWAEVIDVNLSGVANCCGAVLPGMERRGHGAIVIVSSINALAGSAGMAAYDASKAGVLGLMRSLAIDYGPRGIRVNAVCPGNTITEYHIDTLAERGIDEKRIRQMMSDYGLLNRAAEPAEIANAIGFLAGDQASFVTGETLVVDGGFSLARG